MTISAFAASSEPPQPDDWRNKKNKQIYNKDILSLPKNRMVHLPLFDKVFKDIPTDVTIVRR